MVKPINKKTPKGAMERISDIEQMLPQIINAVNQGMMQSDQKLLALAEMVEAIVSHIGTDTVDALVMAKREEKDRERVERSQQWLREKIAAGAIQMIDAVEEGALIVGVETDKDGKQLGAGNVQLTTDRVIPEILARIMGQGPGFRTETDAGFFEILEVYKSVSPQVPDMTTPETTPEMAVANAGE